MSLFSGQGSGAGGTVDPSARSERFPQITVDDRGEISLPYIGRIAVAGLTTAQIAQAINQNLMAKSQMPQALVTVTLGRGVARRDRRRRQRGRRRPDPALRDGGRRG